MLVIGLTIVAFGTSAPELAMNVVAAASGQTALAFGNVVGSNIANIGLVIGLCALMTPLVVSSRIIRLELPWLIVITALFLALVWLPPGVAGHMGTDRIDGIVLVLNLFFFPWFLTVTNSSRFSGNCLLPRGFRGKPWRVSIWNDMLDAAPRSVIDNH